MSKFFDINPAVADREYKKGQLFPKSPKSSKSGKKTGSLPSIRESQEEECIIIDS